MSPRTLALALLTTAATAAANPPAEPAEPCAPVSALNAMDPRKPVPLLPMMAWHQKQNMQEHLVAIQRIIDGLARADWDEVLKAAALIQPSAQMNQMCHHMGAGAEGFTALALDFHQRAGLPPRSAASGNRSG